MCKVIKYTTFYKIIKPSKSINRLIKRLSSVNYYTKKREPYAYIKDEGKDVYRFPVGIGDNIIKTTLGVKEIYHGGGLVTNEVFSYKMDNNPFKIQEKIIDNAFNQFKNKQTQVIIDSPTGRGKTFTGIYLNYKLKGRPLIFVYENKLAEQWAESYVEHTSIDPKQIYIIKGSKDMLGLLDIGHEFDIFIVTHATIRSFFKKYGVKKLNEFFIQTDINIKIYDEFDRESQNMFNIDMHTSIPYNIYLSATPFRSGTYDNKAFQFAFEKTYQLGVEFYADSKPNRNAHFMFYESKPSRKEDNRCHQWRPNPNKSERDSSKKWLKSFDLNKYHQFLLGFKDGYRPREDMIEAIKAPIEDFKRSMQVDPERTHIITTGLTQNCDKLKKLLIEKFDIDTDDIGIYNYKIKKKKKALTKPIIISLTSSMGRGLDIDKIYGILDIEAYGSLSIFKQLVGRVGRIGGMEGVYYKIIDMSFENTYRYYKGFKKILKDEFKNIKYTKIE